MIQTWKAKGKQQLAYHLDSVEKSHSNSKQELGHVDSARTVRVELIKDLLSLIITYFKPGVAQAFGELWQVQSFVAIVVDSSETSAQPQNA